MLVVLHKPTKTFLKTSVVRQSRQGILKQGYIHWDNVNSSLSAQKFLIIYTVKQYRLYCIESFFGH